MERESRKEADERREAVISSATSLRPNFKPKSGITESQLSKFQELMGKGRPTRTAEIQESSDQEPSKSTVDGTGDLKPENRVVNISCGVDNVATNAAAKTRHKLYWGYVVELKGEGDAAEIVSIIEGYLLQLQRR